MKNRAVERKPLFDNLKFIGIFLVVFAHILENKFYQSTDTLYRIIYLFHMPLFIFIAGYFAKFNFKKIVLYLLMPYVVLQTTYSFYEYFNMVRVPTVEYILIPRWTLWFLLAMAVWKSSVLLLEKVKRFLPLILIVSTIAGLWFGFLSIEGKVLSISRIVTMYPYFVLGYYCKQIDFTNIRIFKTIIVKTILTILSVGLIVGFLYIFPHAPRRALFNVFMYNQLRNYHMFVRLYMYLAGFVSVLALCCIIPNKQLGITRFGKHTFSIYILHSMILFFLGEYIFVYKSCFIFKSIILTAILIVVCVLMELLCKKILRCIKRKIRVDK